MIIKIFKNIINFLNQDIYVDLVRFFYLIFIILTTSIISLYIIINCHFYECSCVFSDQYIHKEFLKTNLLSILDKFTDSILYTIYMPDIVMTLVILYFFFLCIIFITNKKNYYSALIQITLLCIYFLRVATFWRPD